MAVLNRFILVEVVNERKSSSGFEMTASTITGSLYQRGIVKDKSDEVKTMEIGDEIFYNKSSGHLLRLPDGSDVYVIQERDVVIVL
jgi:co-chaperonin GroES (HSP10)